MGAYVMDGEGNYVWDETVEPDLEDNPYGFVYTPEEDTNVGLKYDKEKLRYDLIPTILLRAVAEVLTFGAEKYGDRNWEKGIEYNRVFGALLRHLYAWWDGEDADPETGLNPLWHAACNMAFLIHYIEHGMPDNRPIYEDKNNG